MKRRNIVLLFIIGHVVAVNLVYAYVFLLSKSTERHFHGFVMYVAAGWSFPAMISFLRITVDMWERAVRQEGVLVEVRDSLVPVAKDARAVATEFKELIDDVKKRDFHRIIEFADQLAKNGTVEALAANIRKIAERVHVAVEAPSGELRSKEDIVRDIPNTGEEDL
jgi:hypothetical protein